MQLQLPGTLERGVVHTCGHEHHHGAGHRLLAPQLLLRGLVQLVHHEARDLRCGAPATAVGDGVGGGWFGETGIRNHLGKPRPGQNEVKKTEKNENLKSTTGWKDGRTGSAPQKMLPNSTLASLHKVSPPSSGWEGEGGGPDRPGRGPSPRAGPTRCCTPTPGWRCACHPSRPTARATLWQPRP